MSSDLLINTMHKVVIAMRNPNRQCLNFSTAVHVQLGPRLWFSKFNFRNPVECRGEKEGEKRERERRETKGINCTCLELLKIFLHVRFLPACFIPDQIMPELPYLLCLIISCLCSSSQYKGTSWYKCCFNSFQIIHWKYRHVILPNPGGICSSRALVLLRYCLNNWCTTV